MLLFVNVFYCYKQVYRRFFLFFSYFFNNIPVSFLFIVYFFSKRTFFSLYNLHYTFHLKLHSFLIRRLTCRKEKEGITLHNPLLTSFLISSTIRTFSVPLPQFQFGGAIPGSGVWKDRSVCAGYRPVCCCRRSVYLDNLLFQRSVQPVGGW